MARPPDRAAAGADGPAGGPAIRWRRLRRDRARGRFRRQAVWRLGWPAAGGVTGGGVAIGLRAAGGVAHTAADAEIRRSLCPSAGNWGSGTGSRPPLNWHELHRNRGMTEPSRPTFSAYRYGGSGIHLVVVAEHDPAVDGHDRDAATVGDVAAVVESLARPNQLDRVSQTEGLDVACEPVSECPFQGIVGVGGQRAQR